jgi:hypothetical protein
MQYRVQRLASDAVLVEMLGQGRAVLSAEARGAVIIGIVHCAEHARDGEITEGISLHIIPDLADGLFAGNELGML